MFVVALFAGLPQTLIRHGFHLRLLLAEDTSDLRRCVTQFVRETAGAAQHIINLSGNRTWQLFFEKAGDRVYGGACLVFRDTRLLSDAFDQFVHFPLPFVTDLDRYECGTRYTTHLMDPEQRFYLRDDPRNKDSNSLVASSTVFLADSTDSAASRASASTVFAREVASS